MNKTLSFLLLGLLSVCSLQADFVPSNDSYYNDGLVPESTISFSTGWRWDRVRTHERIFNLEGDFFGDNIERYKDLNVLEVGVQGTLAIPSSYCDSGFDWVSQLYLDGYAYWGVLGNSGKRKFQSFSASDLIEDGSITRHVRSGKTENYQIALGWLYPVSCEFGIAPVLGYSWDYLTVRPSTLIKYDGLLEQPAVAIAQYASLDFEGPFLGVNLVYDLCDYRINAGYEYHWIEAKNTYHNNKFEINPELCVVPRVVIKNKDAHGQVGYLDATWDICDCWALTLGAKYRDFISKKQKVARLQGAEVNPEICDGHTHTFSWQSWEVTFDVAYRF